MDHAIPGHVAPDASSFLFPGTDLDYTKCVFEKFSLQVAPEQLLFFGHPSVEEVSWKRSVWPPPKQHDHEQLGGHKGEHA